MEKKHMFQTTNQYRIFHQPSSHWGTPTMESVEVFMDWGMPSLKRPLGAHFKYPKTSVFQTEFARDSFETKL